MERGEMKEPNPAEESGVNGYGKVNSSRSAEVGGKERERGKTKGFEEKRRKEREIGEMSSFF